MLVELERAGGCGLRPFALEEALLVPQYGLSRLLACMEAAGLVAQELPRGRPRPDGGADGRRHALRQRMWPVYARAVQEAVGARLSEAQAEALAELLGRLAAHATPQRGTGGPGAALSE